jgi:hypothetical protein
VVEAEPEADGAAEVALALSNVMMSCPSRVVFNWAGQMPSKADG